MDIITKESHEVLVYHPFPKPDNYVTGYDYQTQVHFKKSIEQNENIIFIVTIEVEQLIDKTRSLCMFNTLSKYEVSISKDDLSLHNNWHPLVQRSVIECNKLYKEKVKGTYLEGTDIPPMV